MWKKLLVSFLALLGTFSVVYVVNSKLSANSTAGYSSGGTITGRVNLAPLSSDGSTVVGNSIGMQKGDKLLLSMKDRTNKSIAWQLLKKHTYTTYNRDAEGNVLVNDNTPEIKAWFAGSESSTGKIQPYNQAPTEVCTGYGGRNQFSMANYLTSSNLYSQIILPINNQIQESDRKLIRPRNLVSQSLPSAFGESANIYGYSEGLRKYFEAGEGAFILSPAEYLSAIAGDNNSSNSLYNGSSYDRLANLSIDKPYLLNTYYCNSSLVFGVSPTGEWLDGGDSRYPVSWNIENETRSFMYLDTEDIVFATSLGMGSGYGKVEETTFASNYYEDSLLSTVTEGFQAMKARVRNENMSVQLNGILSSQGNALSTSTANNSLKLKVTANTIVDNTGTNTISVIIFENNHFVYYKPLAPTQNGEYIYDFDITGLEANKTYQIGVVNEIYNEQSDAPANSSLISNLLPLSIVEPLDNLSFTQLENLVYGNNVSVGDTVGEISSENGTGSAIYTLIADPAHPNDVNSFDLAEDGKKIIVKDSDLDAGSYYFKIKATDQDNLPNPPLEIPATVNVSKAEAEINFGVSSLEKNKDDDPFTLAFTHTNTDTEDESFQISYESTLTSVATVDSATDGNDLDILITPINEGSTTIKVTIEESKNFEKATASIVLQIYPTMQASFIPISNSIPVSSIHTVGSVIGNVSLTANTPNYRYSIEADPEDIDAGEHNSLFAVRNTEATNSSTMEIITAQENIPPDTYKVTIKVVDRTNKAVYVKGTIDVVGLTQTGFEFYNYMEATMNNPVTGSTMDIAFNETAHLVALGGESTGSISYGLASGEPSDVIGVGLDGTITVHKLGRVKVKATKASDMTYSSKTIYMYINVVKAKQSIAFEDPSPTKLVRRGSDNFTELAIGNLINGNLREEGVGGITYKSSNSSVIEIDATTGEIQVGENGTATITATLNDNDSSNVSYDSNYETVVATKIIRVYEGLSAEWTPAQSLQAGNTATRDAIAGSVMAFNNTGRLSYSVVEANSDPRNADCEKFYMDGNNLMLSSAISGSDIAGHVGGNSYKVQVLISDTIDANTTDTHIVDCEVLISDAENEVMFTKNGNDIQEVRYTYGQTNSFPLSVRSSNSGAITYEIEADAADDIITIRGSTATINKAGVTTIKAKVAASNGFEEGSATLRVQIDKGTQAIAFSNGNETSYQAYSQGTSIVESAMLTGNTNGTIEYTTMTPTICSYTAPGTVTAQSVGVCTIKVANRDANYEPIEATKSIIFYTGSIVSFSQSESQIPQAENDATAGRNVGTLNVQGGLDEAEYSYAIHSEVGSENQHSSFFSVDPTYGTLSLNADIQAANIAASRYDNEKQSYILKVQVDVTNEVTNEVVVKDCEVEIKGAKLRGIGFDNGNGSATNLITRVYSPSDTFSVALVGNAGNGRPTYSLKEGSPEDVIDPQINGNILTVRNANAQEVTTPVMIEANIAAKNGYEKTVVECEIRITRAEQNQFQFGQAVYILPPGMRVDPILNGIMSKQADGTPSTYTLRSTNTNMIQIDGTTLVIGNTLSDEEGVEITAFVEKDRNYNSATASAHVIISNAPAYSFMIEVDSVTYGEQAQARISVSEHSIGALLTQEWTSSDPSVATVDEQGRFTILKAGRTTITCIQRSSLDDPVMSSAVLTVLPKPITITIENATKKVGEEVPIFNATIPQDQLVGNDTLEQPDIVAQYEGESVDTNTPAGIYPMTGCYASDRYPNYAITFTQGELTITQDESQDNWFYVEGASSQERLDPTKWHKEDLKIVLNREHTYDYDILSIDQTSWDTSHILVDKEDEMNAYVYFQNAETHALATPQETLLKIDKTRPEIISIQGYPIEQNVISELLHNLTFGIFFKPRTEITIEAKDILPEGTTISSGIHEVAYEIYVVDKDTGLPNLQEPYDTGTASLNEDSKAEFSIADTGLYRVCATTTDEAGNTSNMKCSDLNIKNIDVDIDHDGELDFVDSNSDGCPDLNIVLGEDEQGNTMKMNIAMQDKKYPYMNIDSDGDGIADLNIDSDQDGRPDLNLVIVQEEDWKPNVCVRTSQLSMYSNPSEYCTGTNLKPKINIAIIKDERRNSGMVPSLNIDRNGDMKPDLNIIKNEQDEIPYLNIVKIDSWKPASVYEYQGFIYDSIGDDENDPKPVTNIDTNQDGYPDVNIDFNRDGVPELNIDVDGDGIPDVDIDGNGDGIPDYNLDADEDGKPTKNIIHLEAWRPEKTDCKNDGLEFGTMLIEGDFVLEDNDIQVENGNGQFLPNSAIKVNDITKSLDKDTKDSLDKKAGKQEIKRVYEINYLVNEVVTQPNGNVRVRIPIDPLIKNAKVLVEQADGNFEVVNVVEEDGYYVFETEYVGKVSILGDASDTTEPNPNPEPTSNKPSVQGNYTQNQSGIGGANTGDASSSYLYIYSLVISCGILSIVKYKSKS